MKNSHRLFAALLATVLLMAAAGAQTDTITIVHFNDTHSNLAPIGPRDGSLRGSLGGVARAATLIGMTRMSAPNVIALHAGDTFIGDLFFNRYFGVAELQLLNAIGIDAMAVGNHEFDLSPLVLQMALDSAFVGGGFPLLSCNTILENDTVKTLKKYILPWTVIRRGNVTIGIFGLTTPATNILSNPKPAWIDTNVVADAMAAVDSLSARGCKVVICLSHLGLALDQQIAAAVPGINVIVGGHDHLLLTSGLAVPNAGGDTTWIVQANAFYLNAGIMTLAVSGGKVRVVDYQMKDLDASIPEDPGVAAIVNGLIADIESVYGPLFTKRIGFAAEDFGEVAVHPTSDGPMDTPVGNLVTDAFRAATGTEIAIEVGGSTAQKIYRGPLVAADLFRVVGYGFNEGNGLGYRLATMKMSGEALVAGLEFGLAAIESDDEFLIQSSGLTYVYNAHRPAGSRVAGVMVGAQQLDPGRLYTVTANEFVPMFLENLQIPFTDLHVCTGDTTEFQVLAAYVAALDTISPNEQNRVVSPVNEELSGTPKEYRLNQNYPNPFNPSTHISVDCPARADVTLEVFDMLGRSVATIMRGTVGPGTYTITWNAAGMPSGLYLCRLSAGSTLLTRKMVLIK